MVWEELQAYGNKIVDVTNEILNYTNSKHLLIASFTFTVGLNPNSLSILLINFGTR